MTQLSFEKLRLPTMIKKYFCKLFLSKSIAGKCNKIHDFDNKDCEKKMPTQDKITIGSNQYKKLYSRNKSLNAREKMSQKSLLTQKSSADLHGELMIMFHEAKQAGSIVEVREVY